jgi:hypothetical protein
MSLVIKLSAEEAKNSFVIYDCTGKYSSSNEGGYDYKNPRVSDIQEAYLEIKSPSSKTPVIVNVLNKLPNENGDGFEIMPYMVSLGQAVPEIESGKWEIKAIFKGVDKKGADFVATGYLTKVFVNSITCCIDRHMKIVGKDAFKDEKQKKVLELSNLLETVNYQINCELYNEANTVIEYLKAQCKCCGC